MSWIVAAAAGALALVLACLFRRPGRAQAGDAAVTFELRLPSKWAAELTARTLDNGGVPASVHPAGSTWTCRVRQTVSTHPANVARLCQRFGQIAEARGGECIAHRIQTKRGVVVFEHERRG